MDIHDVIYVHIDKKKKFPATALLRALGYGSNSDILRLFFAVRELDLVKKRETRIDQREVLGAIIAEDIALAGEASRSGSTQAQDQEGARPARARRVRASVREGDELTEEVFNRLRRLNIDTVKVFASYTLVDLRDEMDAVERGERAVRRMRRASTRSTRDTGEVIAEVGEVAHRR